jgi:RNA polymerase sigma-70 factor, ECF subfamily
MDGQGQPSLAELACELQLSSSLPEAQAAARGIEAEVMSLFEQYRAPLLRYAVSFGVPVHDAEEIVQEVFLALFRHLRLGRSRRNLRGWIFRVAHNLTLKQRYANKRLLDAVNDDPAIAALLADPSPSPEDSCSQMQRQ